MSDVIQRVQAKITRAKQHVQDFQLGLSAFYKTSPYEVVFDEDAQIRKGVFRIAKAEPVPHALAAIAADVIQNLRSSLDQIAYQLVLDARAGTEPEWLVYYPISGSAASYPATRRSKIKGVRQEVVDAIDATEPYQGGKGHALWQLNMLNRSDKHELLVGAASFVNSTLRSPLVPFLSIGFGAENTIAKIGNVLVGCEPEVAQYFSFSFHVAFNEPGIIDPEPALKTMHDMSNLVDDIVTQLGRFLN